MQRLMRTPLLAGIIGAVACAAAVVHGQQPAADVVLTNGKIITVDNKFTIAQAMAIRGDRFIAVGSNAEINKLAGPNTRRVDLGGKAVIPGLIDAHAHLTRGAETWTTEARFDDVASRKQALDIVRAKAAELGAGKFVYNLGGWSYDQFADNPTPLTRAELDAAAPNNPVYLQFSRCCAFMNSKAVELLGIDAIKQPWVERDAAGKPTGRINDPGLAQVANKLPEKDRAKDPYPVSALATEVARKGMPLQQHATISESFSFFLDQIEAINKEYPIHSLRWAFCHMDQVSASDLDRMRKLGMWAAVRAIPPVMGEAFHRAHGDRSYDMPPLRMIQDSGILWGFHTDTNEVNQYNPFYTLWFAVTGKMVGGKVVNHQTITREEALIAHTRSNSFFLMREDDLGSIAAGKLADLV